MSFIDRKLLPVSLALLLVGSACTKNTPAIGTTPEAKPVPPAPIVPVPVSTIPVLSERRRMGIQLENLDFSKALGSPFQKGAIFDAGRIKVASEVVYYNARFNPQQLLVLAKECEWDEKRENIYIVLRDSYTAPDGDETSFFVDISKEKPKDKDTAEVTVIAVIGLSRVFQDTKTDLDRSFEVALANRSQATLNLANIHTNRLLAGGICTALAAGRLPNPSQDNLNRIKQQVSQSAARYGNRLLAGVDLPVFSVSQKNQTPRLD